MDSQCTICCDSYLIPRLLNCLHYFCQCCIESVQVNGKVNCSICREETFFTSVRQLPYHPLYFHNANSTTKERTCSVCNQPAAMFCVDCDDDYCAACCNVHEKMKVTRNHLLQPSKCNPKLMTCELHESKILDYYCLECEKLLCNQCTSCDQRSHHIVSTSDACKSFKEKHLLGGQMKLNKVLDSLDVVKNNYTLQRKQEKDHGINLKREVHQRTNYIISMLQSREKSICEQIDLAVDENTSLIEQKIDCTKKSMEKVTNFLEICEEWRKMPVNNALLQLKPLLNQRLYQIMEENRIEQNNSSLKLDSISWTDKVCETILPLIEEYGDLQITKASLNASKTSFQKWSYELQTPMGLSKANQENHVYVIESLWKAQKQKLRVRKVSIEGKVIADVWACSKSCSSLSDMISPVIASNDDKMLAVGIGHEVILVNSATKKKSYKFGKQGNYPGQLQGISCVAFSSVGNILVADYVLNRVSMFSSEGEFILCFGTSSKNSSANEYSLSNPSALAIDAQDHVYVADTDNHRIVVFNHEGCYLRSIGCKGYRLQEFVEPCALVLSETVLVVLEKGNKRIQFICLENDNTVIGSLNLVNVTLPRHLIWIKSPCSEEKEDLSGNILVADSENVYVKSLFVE